jgi:hypothetical protein
MASRRLTGVPAARLADSWRMRRSPPEQGEAAAVEGGDGGVPVDGGHRGAAVGAAGDEPAREVAAFTDRPSC